MGQPWSSKSTVTTLTASTAKVLFYDPDEVLPANQNKLITVANLITGAGFSYVAANNGITSSFSGVTTTFALGSTSAGTGAHDFTANRYQYLAGFTYQLGGTKANDLFSLNGTSGAVKVSAAGSENTSILHGVGAIFTGGTSTTTKPYWLIEPTGTTSTGWSTAGTLFGANAATGFTGNIFDGQHNGVSKFKVDYNGLTTAMGGFQSIAYNESFLRIGFNNGVNYAPQNYIISSGVGILRITDNTEGAFNRFQYGGTTSSYPSWQRNGAGFNARLADDSGYTFVNVLDEAYGSGWNGSIQVPTKNAVYDKIEALNIVAGVAYTPTTSNLTNISAVTVNNFQYFRVGNVVTVSGNIAITVTTTAIPTSLEISLPVASNFSNVGDCAGTGCANSSDAAGQIVAQVSNDNALFDCTPTLTGSRNIAIQFTYIIK